MSIGHFALGLAAKGVSPKPSPPASSLHAIAVAGVLGAIVFLGISAWLDRHRVA